MNSLGKESLDEVVIFFLLFGWFELVGCTQGDEEAKSSPIGNGQGKLTNEA